MNNKNELERFHGAPAQPPVPSHLVRDGAIPLAINLIGESREALSIALEELRERLAPALSARHDQSSEGCASGHPAGLAPLAESLLQHRVDLEAMVAFVRDLTARVEV